MNSGIHWPLTLLRTIVAALGLLPGGPLTAAPEKLLDAFTSEVTTVADGLPQSNIQQMTVGPDGCLWVTTPEHVCRFDGVRFEKVPELPGFDPATSPLTAASIAADGALWVHGYRKIWRFHQARWQSLGDALFAARTDGNEDIVSMHHEADGSTWWLLRGGLVQWRPGQPLRQWLEPRTPPLGEWCSDFLIDRRGTCWITRWNGLARIDGDTMVPVPAVGLLDDRPFAMRLATRRAGGTWLYAATGLFVIGDDGRIESVAPFENAPRAERIIEAEDGAVWAVGDTGVHRWHHGRWGFLHPGQVPGVTRFTTIATSANGSLWLGGDGGLVNLRPRGYRLREVPGLPFTDDRSPTAAWTNGVDETLVGVRDRIYRMSGPDGEAPLLATVPGASQPGASVISVITRDANDKLWVGTGNEQLWLLEDGLWQHSVTDPASPVPAVGITALLPWPGQPPFIGSVNGLMVLTARNSLLPAHPTLPLDRVRCLVRDPARSGMWIGYESRGLVYYDPSPNQLGALNVLGGLPPGRVNAVLPEPDGTLWISVGESIIRWQHGRIAFEFTRRHGLPPGEIGLLADDGEGRLWLASEGSLACIRREDFAAVEAGRRQTLRVRHHGGGLPAKTAFNPVLGQPSPLPGARFAACGGVLEARASHLPAATRPPLVRLHTIASRARVLANLDPLFPGGQPPAPVRVPAGFSPIDIEFTAIDAGPPDSQQFRFRIEGLDPAWTDLGNTRRLNLPFLPPGLHRLEIATQDANGEWSDSTTAVTLSVAAHFWQTRWFLGLSILAGVALVFALTRWRVRRRYRRRLEREKAIYQERSRIGRDIHDDLGAGLTHLAMVARIAERDVIQQAPPAVLAGHLQEVFNEAGAMVRSVDEIVWAVTPANDHLMALTDYLGQYAQHFLRAAGIGCRVDLPAAIPPLPMRSAVRHHLYMVVHEALNNIVKHAGASQVQLTVTLTDGRLGISVADDGCGFDPAQAATRDDCDGLRNFACRMAQIGGRYGLDTAPGKGTRTQFEIPLEQVNQPIHPS